LEDLRNFGESSCNPGDGKDQRAQSFMFMMMIIDISVKGKPIPLQAWTGPEGSRRLRLPDFKTVGT
jgi:hypothetical protein